MEHILNPSTVNNLGVTEYFLRHRHNRAAIRERTGAPALPADRCPPFVIPDGHCTCDDRATRERVERELQKVDPRFRIMHDPLTATNGGPGYHLYLRNKNHYPNGLDQLVLEFSVQRDPAKPWPSGGPCTPGMWLVDFVKRSLKKDWTDYVDRTKERADDRQRKDNRRTAEEERFYRKEVFEPVYCRGALGNTGTSKDLKAFGRQKLLSTRRPKTKLLSAAGVTRRARRALDHE
jgi:hypothetical protein